MQLTIRIGFGEGVPRNDGSGSRESDISMPHIDPQPEAWRKQREEHSQKVKFFYADESWIDIEGKRHLIMGAIAPYDPEWLSFQMLKLKMGLGLAPSYEVKWNMKRDLGTETRIAVTTGVGEILNLGCDGLVSLVEGADKNHAANLLCEQIQDYCAESAFPAYALYYDEGMIPDHERLSRLLQADRNRPSCGGLHSVVSASEQITQCCDIFVGLFRQTIRHEVESIRKPIKVHYDDLNPELEMTISEYTQMMTRFVLWGRCTDTDSAIKHCVGRGFRVHSSISEKARNILAKAVGTTYLGCMH